MRPREPALLERLKEIVDVVNQYAPGVPVVANGDCWGVQDRDRICEMTGEFAFSLSFSAACSRWALPFRIPDV